ncbi:P-loop containing nucleoside triphosphate hydrolase protein [Aspergillus avenaceus]|uniref:P-loop containing nucleoside triphosphate hydrolase protein n=1 Tax=Aspergillus avenaceus TaxID=36643 RepID=A0A5N6U2F7_ASPAV|nr:P-loop containing nucleoside triphosphate hydrolase protein [Aspergillus avenaceus]
MTLTPKTDPQGAKHPEPILCSEKDHEIAEYEHGYKFRLHDGRVMPPFIGLERYKMTRSLPLRNTDICFVSWPRPGSTWLSYILVLLTGAEGKSLRDCYHWLESGWLYERGEEEIREAKDPRIFVSHMPYDMALGGDPSQTPCRYIYIARNPKDSWSGWYSGSWDHWLNMFMNGKCHRGDWNEKNILFLQYEDLLKDTRTGIKNIAQFLDIKLSDDALDAITAKASFSQMKGDKFTGMSDVKEAGQFYRKGKIGSWREQFTVAQNDTFDKLYKDRMSNTGLEFEF